MKRSSSRGARSDGRRQQCRDRADRACGTARGWPRQADHLLVPAQFRLRRVRGALCRGPDRAGARAAGHHQRADALCAAAGLGGFYSPVSVGTRLAEGKGASRDRRPDVCAGKAAEGRRGAARRRPRRPLGQSDLPQNRRATSTRRWRCRRASRSLRYAIIVEPRRDRPRDGHHSRHLCRPPRRKFPGKRRNRMPLETSLKSPGGPRRISRTAPM